MSGSYIYILGSHTGTLYIGVTSNLYLRVMQHKEGTLEGFTAAYGCERLLSSTSSGGSIPSSKTLHRPGDGK
jgi:predicted GIY-YIG superfamily endonuclease